MDTTLELILHKPEGAAVTQLLQLRVNGKPTEITTWVVSKLEPNTYPISYEDDGVRVFPFGPDLTESLRARWEMNNG